MDIRRSRSVGGVVLSDSGEVAMVRHSISNGAWLFPKGKVEPGEDDETAARREIEEEAGLTNLELIGDLGSYERNHIKPDGTPDMDEVKEIKMFLFAAPPDAMPVPSMEMDGARWVQLSRVVEECGNTADKAWFVSVFERVRQSVQRG